MLLGELWFSTACIPPGSFISYSSHVYGSNHSDFCLLNFLRQLMALQLGSTQGNYEADCNDRARCYFE